MAASASNRRNNSRRSNRAAEVEVATVDEAEVQAPVEQTEVPVTEEVQEEVPAPQQLTTIANVFNNAPAPAPQVEVQDEPEVVVERTHRDARVNATWSLYYGGRRYDFVAGQVYNLPLEVFNYLRNSGNLLPLKQDY